jgi:hypothetical protein
MGFDAWRGDAWTYPPSLYLVGTLPISPRAQLWTLDLDLYYSENHLAYDMYIHSTIPTSSTCDSEIAQVYNT